ncbi:ATP-binding protein [Micromonospora sp. DT81.3]|uniref:ATP-binding protein n=1 Tax=Micromonospora sp. DT81.3 TaxID=3416523 RepID=UPI003CF71CB3
MKIPATAMTSNLMWTRSGVVWATWRLQPLPFSYATATTKGLVKAHHQALFQAHRGEGLLLGLCADLDPVTIVERMLDGVRIDECPDWAKEVELTLDALEQVPLGTRAFWFAVPLAAGDPKARLMSALRSGDQALRDALALPRQLPTQGEIDAAMRMAKEIEARIPAAFQPTRATAAEQIWIALHSQQRGLSVDAVAPVPPARGEADGFDADSLAQFQMPSSMPNPWIDEGGQSDLNPKTGQQFLPFKRRYLKVHSPYAGDESSYQVMQVLVAAPKAGWQSPGVEWMSHVDQLPLDVDWGIRFTVTGADEVKRRNKKAESALREQYQHQEGSATITGGGSDLAQIAESLAAYHASLNRSDREVEVQATMIFTVGADTAELAQRKARFVAAEYKRADFILEAPLGVQEELWWSMLPGIPTTRIARELTQITTGREFATGVPLVSNELGDEKGARFGENISTARHTPILRDADGSIQADTSASFGVVAELGAGKSVLLKCEIGDVVDRQGRIVAIDRTEAKEYASFARSLQPDTTMIVDLMDPSYSVDPLRVFGPRIGARMVQSLFAVMLGIRARDNRGVALSKLLEPDYMAAHDISSLGKLIAHLKSFSSPETDELADLINLVASKDIGEVLFNDGLPAVDLKSRALVFLTHGLSLPDKTELEHKHLYDEMPLEKIYGRAMYAMLMGVTREVCFMNPRELAGGFYDETHHVTASPEGERDLRIGIRDGRKHRAFFGLGSHDPADFGDVQTRGLLKTRFVMRQTDKELARRAIEWLTGETADAAMVKIVTEELSPLGPDGAVPQDRRGEGLMVDQRGRIGKFRKTLPERLDRRSAVLSTPSLVAT